MAWRDVGSAEEIFGVKKGGSFRDVGSFEEIFGQQPSAEFGSPGNPYAEQIGPRWQPSDERVAKEERSARDMLASDFAFADATLKKAAAVASAPVGAALRFGTLGVMGESADALHRDAQVLGQLGAESAERSSVPMAGRLSTAAGTLLGIAPMAGLAAATGGAAMVPKALPFVFGAGRGSEALTEAKDTGKTGWESAKYAAREAAIETGTTLVFNKLGKILPGFGGVEQLGFAREPIRKAVGKALAGTAGEVLEEDAIAIASAVNKAWSEVDTKATDDVGKILYDTTLDTLATMGLGNSPRLIGSSLDVARRFVQRNPEQAKAIASVESATRRNLAEAGLGAGPKEDREKAVENIREAIREIQAGDMARLDPGGRVMVDDVKDGVASVRGDFGTAEVGVDELTDHVPIRPRPDEVIQPTRTKSPRYATPGEKQVAATSDFGDVQVDDQVTDTKYKISGKVVSIDGLFAEVANRHGHKRRVPLGRLEIKSRPGIPRAAELQPYPEGVNEDFIRPTGGSLRSESASPSQAVTQEGLPTDASRLPGGEGVANEVPAERNLGRPRVERTAVTAAFPTARVTDLPAGDGYRVELPNGRWGSVRYTDKVAASKQQMEASIGRRLSDEEYDRAIVKGAFTVTTDQGRAYDGDFLIRLIDGNAEAKTVRHEALHLARAFGLVSDAEYSAMAQKYGRPGMGDVDVEEAIARAHEVWRGPKGLWQRFKAWLNDLLSRFGVKPTADTAHSRIARGEVYHRKGLTADEALSQKRERATADGLLSAESGSGKDGDAEWRDSLANPGSNKQARALVNEVRRDMSRPDVRSREQVEVEADTLLRRDYAGVKQRIFEKAAAGGQLTDTETAAAKRIISRDGYKAVIAGDEKAMAEAAESIRAYTRAGTEQARGLQMRFDPHETPTERRQRQLAEAILEPSKDLKDRIDAAIKVGDEQLANSLKEKANKEAEELRQFLTDNGLLPTSKKDLDDLLGDPVRIDRIVREAWAHKGSAGSKAYGRLREYWNSAGLLSGPVTMVRNGLGTPINYGLMLADRMAAAAGRVLTSNDRASDVGSAFRHAIAGIWPAVTSAARHAMQSYITETSTFDAQLGREPFLADKLEGKGRYAIPGMTGRIVRGIGWGPLRATDQFWKALIGTLEVGREAYNIARAEGLEGKALSTRIAELTTTLDSDAWVKAMATADKATFTEEGSEGRAKFKRNVKALRESTLGIGGFILPFVDTPVNIAAQVIERSPIGLLYIAQKIRDNRAANRGLFDGMSERLANQAVGWAMILGIGSLFNDDDDQWLALTSGSHAKHPYSLKLGDAYLSYQGIEPLASFFGMVTDAKNVFSSDGDVASKMGGMFDAVVEQVANKPMLEGIADVLRVIQGRGTKTEDRGQQIADNFAMWATNFGPSWVPNLYRQSVRSLREDMPETKIWADPNDPDARWRRMRDRALVQAGFKSAETAKYDLFGNKKKAAVFAENPTSDFFYRLLSPMRTEVEAAHPGNAMIAAWNRQNPKEQFKIPSLSPSFTHAGKSYAMSDDQFARFQKLAGQTANRLFRVASFDVERPTAVQMQQLEKIFEEAAGASRDAMKQEVVGGKSVSVTADQLAPIVRRVRMASLREQLSRSVAARKPGETDKSFADRRKQHFASQAMAREELRRWASGGNALPAELLTSAGGE